jgi:hypothetical protein
MAVMNILLQNVQTKLFFRYGRVWASSPDVAYDFRTPQAVFDFVEKESLQDVQLVVKLQNPERFEVVPLETHAPATLPAGVSRSNTLPRSHAPPTP